MCITFIFFSRSEHSRHKAYSPTNKVHVCLYMYMYTSLIHVHNMHVQCLYMYMYMHVHVFSRGFKFFNLPSPLTYSPITVTMVTIADTTADTSRLLVVMATTVVSRDTADSCRRRR